MPIVRLSGRVTGSNDPHRKTRAKLLYRLFDAGWDIYNGNGDQNITLGNIQKKILESDAFVFTPGATLEDMFQAASIFVGFQTGDRDLHGKSAVLLNSDDSWTPFLQVIDHLYAMGTVKQRHEAILTVTEKARDVVSVIEKKYTERRKQPDAEPDILEERDDTGFRRARIKKPPVSVCVFCSASTKKESYLAEGRRLGEELAGAGFGCISGAGRTGAMGQVVGGAVAGGGWTAGSNIPHIIALEGLPDGLAEFWLRSDIYTRMEVMIEESEAFVVMPGGMGTAQELLALLLLRQQGHDLMRGKEIFLFNRREEGGGFWDPMLALLKQHGMLSLLHVLDDIAGIVPAIQSRMAV